jgi:hypothetical protein
MAGRQRHQHQVGPAGDGVLGTAQIGHQHGDEQARQRSGVGHQLGRVGQLGQQARGHEGADFDLALAGGVGVAYPLLLAFGGQHGLDALKAIAQADLADDGGLRGAGRFWHGKFRVGCFVLGQTLDFPNST